jgi:hypothetical protein
VNQEFCVALVNALQDSINGERTEYLCIAIDQAFKKELQDNLRGHFRYNLVGTSYPPIIEIAFGNRGSELLLTNLSLDAAIAVARELRNEFVRKTLINYMFTPQLDTHGFVNGFSSSNISYSK